MHVATQAEPTPLDGEYKDRGLRIGISTGSGEGSAGLEINRSPLRMSLSSIPSETLNTSVEPQRVVTPECNANRFESNPRKGMLGTGAASRAAQGTLIHRDRVAAQRRPLDPQAADWLRSGTAQPTARWPMPMPRAIAQNFPMTNRSPTNGKW